MTIGEIKEALVGKQFHYWEIDRGFSTDEFYGTVRDVKSNGKYNPHIVFDEYNFDFLSLDAIERLIAERKIEGIEGRIYYKCELRGNTGETTTKLTEKIEETLKRSLVGKHIAYKRGENSDIGIREVKENRTFEVTNVRFDALGNTVSIVGDILTHFLPFKDVVELVDYGVLHESGIRYFSPSTVKWRMYELTDNMISQNNKQWQLTN